MGESVAPWICLGPRLDKRKEAKRKPSSVGNNPCAAFDSIGGYCIQDASQVSSWLFSCECKSSWFCILIPLLLVRVHVSNQLALLPFQDSQFLFYNK